MTESIKIIEDLSVDTSLHHTHTKHKESRKRFKNIHRFINNFVLRESVCVRNFETLVVLGVGMQKESESIIQFDCEL